MIPRGASISGQNHNGQWQKRLEQQRQALLGQIQEWEMGTVAGIAALVEALSWEGAKKEGEGWEEGDIVEFLVAEALEKRGWRRGVGNEWVQQIGRDRVESVIRERKEEGASTSELSRETELSRSSIRRIVGEMEEAGLVGRIGEGNETRYVWR